MKKRNKIKAKQQRAFLHLAQGRLLRKTQDRPFEKLRTGPSKNSGQALRPAWAGSGQALRNAQDKPFEMLRTSPLSCYGEGRIFSSTQKQNCTISYIKMYYKGHYVLSKYKFNSSNFNIIKAL